MHYSYKYTSNTQRVAIETGRFASRNARFALEFLALEDTDKNSIQSQMMPRTLLLAERIHLFPSSLFLLNRSGYLYERGDSDTVQVPHRLQRCIKLATIRWHIRPSPLKEQGQEPLGIDTDLMQYSP